MFSGSGGVFDLHTLSDTPVTLERIRLQLLDMFKNARLDTVIVLYFNGHGSGNSYLLNNHEIINATILIKWIAEIRKEMGESLPVFMIFDHCQLDSPIQPPIDMLENMYIIWACQPGQHSTDFRMAGDEGAEIPRSNLLKAICLFVDEIHTHPAGRGDCFTSRLGGCMNSVMRMMLAEECRKRRCLRPCIVCSCPSYDRCGHEVTRARHAVIQAYPRAQYPGGLFWGYKVSETLLHHSACSPTNSPKKTDLCTHKRAVSVCRTSCRPCLGPSANDGTNNQDAPDVPNTREYLNLHTYFSIAAALTSLNRMTKAILPGRFYG